MISERQYIQRSSSISVWSVSTTTRLYDADPEAENRSFSLAFRSWLSARAGPIAFPFVLELHLYLFDPKAITTEI